jgi:hypothetical protein
MAEITHGCLAAITGAEDVLKPPGGQLAGTIGGFCNTLGPVLPIILLRSGKPS